MKTIHISVAEDNRGYFSGRILIHTIQYRGQEYRVFQGLSNMRPPYSVRNMATMEGKSVQRISDGFVTSEEEE